MGKIKVTKFKLRNGVTDPKLRRDLRFVGCQRGTGSRQNLSAVSISRPGDDRRANARDELETETATEKHVRFLGCGGGHDSALSLGQGGNRLAEDRCRRGRRKGTAERGEHFEREAGLLAQSLAF